jgi:hypothetical protein
LTLESRLLGMMDKASEPSKEALRRYLSVTLNPQSREP